MRSPSKRRPQRFFNQSRKGYRGHLSSVEFVLQWG